jgi:hypothetical protein
MMEDPGRTVALLNELRSMGIAVALDDFGTEYSSLGHLRQFPLDYLKIDQSFVRGIPGKAGDAAIATTIISLSKLLKLPVIAEGVETAEQLAFLEVHGCEEYQGYYFSRPLPANDAEHLLRANLASFAPIAKASEAAAENRPAESAHRAPTTPSARRIGDVEGRGPYDAEHADLRNFFRTVAEINWLLIILVLLYHFFKGTKEDNVPAVFAGMVVFALITIVIHYLKLFPNPTRGLLAVESWIMIAFITWILYFTGGLDSSLGAAVLPADHRQRADARPGRDAAADGPGCRVLRIPRLQRRDAGLVRGVHRHACGAARADGARRLHHYDALERHPQRTRARKADLRDGRADGRLQRTRLQCARRARVQAGGALRSRPVADDDRFR